MMAARYIQRTGDTDEQKSDSSPTECSEEGTDSPNMTGPTRKRVYQSRRNSRACDACRSRKTKCDAPVAGMSEPCTSCVSASLLCKFTESEEGKKKIGPVRRLRMLETTIEELSERLKIAEAKLKAPSITLTENYSPRNTSSRPCTPQQSRRFSPSSGNEGFFPGSTYTLGFMESVQDYMDGLGYDTSLLDARSPKERRSQAAAPSPYETLQIRDLRALLPTKDNGEKFLAIFHQYLIKYLPVMSWPIVQNKFQQAYESPIFSQDRSSVTGTFCVLMTINAYASICSDDSEIFEVPNYSSKRGWYFLEFAKTFHDLNRPTLSLFDVEVLIMIAMYLEVVALPYPLRLTVEYLAKVCKDISLHRKPGYGKFNLRPMELEHRSRMFWCAFLLDRKLALQFGTAPFFDDDEIDVDEPSSNDISDLISSESNMTGLGISGSIVLMRSLVATSRCIGPIFRLDPQADNIEHKSNNFQQLLGRIESNFPDGILAWDNFAPLDPILLDAAMFAMATRLSLYRYFTDPTLSASFRTRCFVQSLEVAKATVHLLQRSMNYPDWQKSVHLRLCGLTCQHIFKVSTILLLAASIFSKPFNASSELHICIGVLQIAAPIRPAVLQSLQILDKVAEILKQKPVATYQGNSNKAGYAPGMNSGSGQSKVPVITTGSSTSPAVISHSTAWPQTSVATLAADVSFLTTSQSPFGPGYQFPSLPLSDPQIESTAWLNQVDSSSWALMQNILQCGELR